MPQQLEPSDVIAIFPEIEQIRNARLRDGVISIWRQVAAEMAWLSLHDISQNSAHLRQRNLVSHIQGVTRTALAIAETAERHQGRTYDRDLLISACLLHDVSKPVEMEPDPTGQVSTGRVSDLGRQLPHAVYATHLILARGLPLELANLVVTHTHSCNVRGTTWESAVLFYADFSDTDGGVSQFGGKMFSERWNLE